jgi:AcrR family transcriptional regulator
MSFVSIESAAPPDPDDDDAPARRRGPRTSGDARAAIVVAATTLFIEHGPEHVSARRIATEAGVDPSLIRYYFGSVESLLAEAMRPEGRLMNPFLDLSKLPPEQRGEALLRAAMSVWEDPKGCAFMIWLTGACNRESRAYKRFVDATPKLWHAALPAGTPQREVDIRSAYVNSVLTGLGITRYVWRMEPLASMPLERLIDSQAPLVQSYLTGPLPE